MTFSASPSHSGQYSVYDILGYQFEVSAKYIPPVTILGKGSSGVVCSFVNSETGTSVAIKKIIDAFENISLAEQALREVTFMRHIDHENVISLIEVIHPPRRENFEDVYIVCERMDHTLHHLIKGLQIKTYQMSMVMYKLLCGLKSIHSANILHRDLNPRNILVSEGFNVKICDFGSACTPSRNERMITTVGTIGYQAPELLLDCNHYTAAVDIWAVGCVFIEMISGKRLFSGNTRKKLLESITLVVGSPEDSDLGFLENEVGRSFLQGLPRYQRDPLGKSFPTLSPDAVDLGEKLLMFDPVKRITAEEALRHPYFVTEDILLEETVYAIPALVPHFEDLTFSLEHIKDLVLDPKPKL